MTNQSIPTIFKEKMAIDQKIKEIFHAPTINFNSAKTDIIEQRRLRRSCEIFVLFNKVTPEGGGSPAAMAA